MPSHISRRVRRRQKARKRESREGNWGKQKGKEVRRGGLREGEKGRMREERCKGEKMVIYIG